MKQDALVLEVAPRTCSNQGRARESRASHGASTSAGPTTQEMDPMTIVLQRLTHRTFNFVRSKVS